MYKLCFAALLLFCGYTSLSQSIVSKELIPPSPNAASLLRYGQIPVNEYTGIPNISLPFYEIKEGGITFPVGMSYHAGGIRVSDVPSWVGAGWSLSAGGVITRTVMGKEDFHANYYENIADYLASSGQDAMDIMGYMSKGEIDSEPDIYYYSFGEYSGKFYLFDDGNFYSVPRNDIKISLEEYGTTARFVLTTPDGVKYIFGRSLDNQKNIYELNSLTYSDGSTADDISSFYLVEVIGVNDERITFDYENEKYFFSSLPYQTEAHVLNQNACGVSTGFQTLSAVTNVSGVRLRKISWTNGSILFEPEPSSRQDLPNSFALKSVQVRNHSEVVKNFALSYIYFGGRLYLEKLTESSQERSYLFHYNARPLPNRLSTSTDHWGFYNGKSNNSYYIPTYIYNGTTYNRANKNSVSEYMKSGVLEQITYPTGGTVRFEFEANSVFSENLSDDGLYYPPEMLHDDDSNIEVSALAQIVNAEFMAQEFELKNDTRVKIELFGDNWNYFTGGCMQLIIEGIDNPRYLFYDGTQPIPTNEFSLLKGKYRIKFIRKTESPDCSFIEADDVWITAKLSYQEVNPAPESKNLTVGGLRIAKITTVADNGQTNEKSYTYNQFLSPGRSSGTLMNPPKNQFERAVGSMWCVEWVIGNTPVYPLGVTSGAYVGYSNVTVVESAGEVIKGKTQSVYTDYIGYPDFYLNEFPYPPPVNFDWKRGLMVERETFKYEDNSYALVERVTNRFAFIAEKKTAAIKAKLHIRYIANYLVRYLRYDVGTGFAFLSESIHERFSSLPGQASSQTNTTYSYDSKEHFKVTSQHLKGSDGRVQFTNFIYPPDYIGLSGVIQDMVERNIIAKPVEIVHGRGEGTSAIITSGNLFAFNSTFPNKIEQIYRLQLPVPLKQSDFKFSNRAIGIHPPLGNISAFQKDPHYKGIENVSVFDASGNISEVNILGMSPVVYLWGYNGQYPVAKIENATYAEVLTALGGGAAATAKLNSLNTANVLDATVITYIQGIRNNLMKALVTTYTYKPLVGMTSMTDPRGIIEYYQYDSLQRLKDVLDFDKNILNNVRYNYRP